MRTALDESAGSRFDVRANIYTLIAITGVVLYWRGVWSLWYVLGERSRPGFKHWVLGDPQFYHVRMTGLW